MEDSPYFFISLLIFLYSKYFKLFSSIVFEGISNVVVCFGVYCSTVIVRLGACIYVCVYFNNNDYGKAGDFTKLRDYTGKWLMGEMSIGKTSINYDLIVTFTKPVK